MRHRVLFQMGLQEHRVGILGHPSPGVALQNRAMTQQGTWSKVAALITVFKAKNFYCLKKKNFPISLSFPNENIGFFFIES